MEKVTLHEGKDISHLKIYLDGENYRKRHYCRHCKNLIGCYCYETLDSAIESCRCHWFCDKHYILDAIHEDIDLVQELPILNTPEIQSIFALGEWDSDEADSVLTLVKQKLDTLSKLEIQSIHSVLSDLIDVDYSEGELCNL